MSRCFPSSDNFFLKHPRRSGGRTSHSIFPPYAQGSSDQIKISSYIELNIHTSKVQAIIYFEIRAGPPSWLHKIERSILKHSHSPVLDSKI
jgi:hypothetical protein